MYQQRAADFRLIPGLKVKTGEEMSLHTSMKVGGPADMLIVPDSLKALQATIRKANSLEIPLFIMGNGTNLIVRKKGIRGIVVKLAGGLNNIKIQDNKIIAGGGALISQVSKKAAKEILTGIEFAEGIPGTVGGAVAMNAGAYGGEMKDVVVKTLCIDVSGELIELVGEEHKFGYRRSVIQDKKLIVVQTELKLNKGEQEKINELMKDFSLRRRTRQPLELPSAGSVFKRPEGYFAGSLIEECGLKGLKVGGAEVSDKHCGFIVNKNNAQAVDVIELIGKIQKIVNEKKGVTLETEVRIVGEE